MAVVTKEDLENAKVDAETLAEFISEDAGMVTPRTGDPYPNVRKIVEDAETALANADIGTAAAAGLVLTLGDFANRSTYEVVPNSGSVARGDRGMTFPIAASGIASEVRVETKRLEGMLDGEVYTFKIGANRSAIFTRILTGIFYANGATYRTPENPPRFTLETGRLYVEIDYKVQAGDESFRPSIQGDSGGTTGAEDWYEITGLSVRLKVPLNNTETANSIMMQQYVGHRILDIDATRANNVIYADDFASLDDAMDAVVDPSPGNWWEIVLSADTVYALSSQLNFKPYVQMIGKGPSSIVRLFQANNVSAGTIIANSVVNVDHTNLLKGFRIEGKNCQYGVHCDTTGQVFNSITIFENMEVVHYGNLAADFPNAWPAQNAIGAGASGGQLLAIRNSMLQANNGNAFSCHNNVNAVNPCKVELTNTLFRTNIENGVAVIAIAEGSGQTDQWVMRNCVLGRWKFSTANPANDMEFNIVCSGNSPAVFFNEHPDANKALYRPFIADEEIQAKNATGSDIAMKTVLAYDGTYSKIRPMTDTDSVSLFAGVAWEPIANGASGRVKNKGYLHITDLIYPSGTAFVMGDTFSIHATLDGQIVKGGTQALFTALNTDAVKIKWPV